MFSLSTTHIRPRICYLSGVDTFAPTVPLEKKNSVSLIKAPESQKEQIKTSISADLHSLESEVTSKKISTILKGKFDSLGLSFDVTKFEKTMQEALSSVMGNLDIPFIAKRKFLEDVNSKVTLLSSVTSVDIENLKTQRNVMSLGVEAMELSGKSEKEKQASYLNKILTETIGKYITPTALGLVEAFSGAQTRIAEVSYQKKSLDVYSAGIVGLDAKYGLSMKGVLDRLHTSSAEKKSDLMTDGISREMRNTIISDLAKRYPIFAAKPSIQTVLATLKVNPSFQIRYTPDMVVDIAGQKIALRDIIEDYSKVNATWQGSEHEIRDARDTALADGVIAKTKNGLGIDQLRSEFDHITPENIEAKMKNASLADIIIMVTQLAQIIPIVGDIGGGSLDIAGAITGISTDGAKMSAVERSLSGLFGALGITVFGGWLNRARKAEKLVGLAKVLPLMQKYLPEKLDVFVKRGGKISEKINKVLLRITEGSRPTIGVDSKRANNLEENKSSIKPIKVELPNNIKSVEAITHKAKFQKGDLVEFSNGRIHQYTQFLEGKILEFDQKTNKYIIEIKNPDSGNINRFSIDAYYVLDKVGSLHTLPFGHGSSSASLFGVIREGGLLPIGVLRKKGIIPFSGTLDDGAIATNGVNNHSVSLSFKQGAKLDHQYATMEAGNMTGWNMKDSIENMGKLSKGLENILVKNKSLGDITDNASSWGIYKEDIKWYKGIGKSTEDFKRDKKNEFDGLIQKYQFSIVLEKKRQQQFAAIGDIERELIKTPFPLIYKIGESPEMKISYGGSEKEANALGGVKIGDIKGILVPKEKISLVERILSDAGITHIRVEVL